MFCNTALPHSAPTAKAGLNGTASGRADLAEANTPRSPIYASGHTCKQPGSYSGIVSRKVPYWGRGVNETYRKINRSGHRVIGPSRHRAIENSIDRLPITRFHDLR